MVLFFAFDFSGDYAINDDWGYTTPIRWWVDEGRLALTHWQSMPFFTQFLFGVAWSEVFGFSQGGLRHLTLIFALVTCVAVFICARSFRLPVSLSVLCAVLPFASPIFVGLSYSFMTDVPAAAFVTLSLLFFVLSFTALDKGARYYALGVAFLLLAVLLRQTALAVALALVVGEPVARGFSLSRMGRPLGVLVATVLAYFAFNALLEAHVGLPRIYSTKSDAVMAFVGDLLAGNFGAIRHSLKALLIAFAQFGLFVWPLLPILCCVLWQRGRWFILGALGGGL